MRGKWKAELGAKSIKHGLLAREAEPDCWGAWRHAGGEAGPESVSRAQMRRQVQKDRGNIWERRVGMGGEAGSQGS